MLPNFRSLLAPAASLPLLLTSATGMAQLAPPTVTLASPAGAEVRITTCSSNVSRHAGTNDRVFLDVHVGRGITTYELDNPGEDRNTGQDNRYVLPGLPTLGSIDALTIRKEGKDAWCIESVDIAANGERVALWGYDANTTDRFPTTPTWGAYRPAEGHYWLDDERRDAPSSFIRFSDERIRVPDTGSFQSEKLVLGVHTCNAKYAESDADIRVKWMHDGVYEEILWKDPGRTRNGFSYLTLTDQTALENLDTLELVTGSTNGWCIDQTSIQLQALNGSPTPGYVSAPNRLMQINRSKYWLDAPKKTSFTPFSNVRVNRPVRGESVHTVFKGLPLLRSGNLAATWDTWLEALPTNRWDICSVPTGFDNDYLERMFVTALTPEIQSLGAYWGKTGYVRIKHVSSSRMQIDVRMEYSVKGENIQVRMRTKADLSCDLDDDGMPTLTIEPIGTPAVTGHLPPAKFAMFMAVDPINTAMGRRINLDVGRFLPSLNTQSYDVNQCFDFSVTESGGLDFGLDPQDVAFLDAANAGCRNLDL